MDQPVRYKIERTIRVASANGQLLASNSVRKSRTLEVQTSRDVLARAPPPDTAIK